MDFMLLIMITIYNYRLATKQKISTKARTKWKELDFHNYTLIRLEDIPLIMYLWISLD